jgi:hypothetical protein
MVMVRERRVLYSDELHDLYCLPNIYLSDKIKEDETGGTYEKREKKKCIQVFVWKNLIEGDVSVLMQGNRKLDLIYGGRVWNGFIWTKIGSSGWIS